MTQYAPTVILKMADSFAYPFFRDLCGKKFSLEITIGETVASVKQRLEAHTKRRILNLILFGTALEDNAIVNSRWREANTIHVIYPKVTST